MQGLWMLRLREVAAILAVVAAVVLLGLFYYWVYDTPSERDELVDARILGFHGFLFKAEHRHVVLARVRLPDGRIQNVAWPRSGRASHCRKGDSVRLIRNGVRLRVYRDGCSAAFNPLRAAAPP